MLLITFTAVGRLNDVLLYSKIGVLNSYTPTTLLSLLLLVLSSFLQIPQAIMIIITDITPILLILFILHGVRAVNWPGFKDYECLQFWVRTGWVILRVTYFLIRYSSAKGSWDPFVFVFKCIVTFCKASQLSHCFVMMFVSRLIFLSSLGILTISSLHCSVGECQFLSICIHVLYLKEQIQISWFYENDKWIVIGNTMNTVITYISFEDEYCDGLQLTSQDK